MMLPACPSDSEIPRIFFLQCVRSDSFVVLFPSGGDECDRDSFPLIGQRVDVPLSILDLARWKCAFKHRYSFPGIHARIKAHEYPIGVGFRVPLIVLLHGGRFLSFSGIRKMVYSFRLVHYL